MRTLTLFPQLTETQFHDRTRWTLFISTLVLVALLLFGCLSTQAHWDSETFDPKTGITTRSSRGYSRSDTRAAGDMAGDTAGGLSGFLVDSGLAGTNPIIGGVAGILGLTAGLFHGRRVKTAEDNGWDTAKRESSQPIVVLGSPAGGVPVRPSDSANVTSGFHA